MAEHRLLPDPGQDDLLAYNPCAVGVHVCGFGETYCYTAANVNAPNVEAARTLFDSAKAAYASGNGEPEDFLVDLCCGDGPVDDFAISRQMVEPLLRTLAGSRNDG